MKTNLRSLLAFCPSFSCQIVAMPHSILPGAEVVIKGVTDDLGHLTLNARTKSRLLGVPL